MKLFLIRHTSVLVPPGTTYGFTDVPLRPTFEEEAERTRAQLAGLQFDQVYCSPLSRCRRLAAACGFENPILDDRLKELNFGEWEMKTWEEVSADPRSERWFADWIHTPAPGGESLQDQYNRLANFLDELRRKPYQQVAIFAHGGILTCARVYAGEYGLEEAFKHVTEYGGVTKIALEEGNALR